MASLDDAGKTTTLYCLKLNTAVMIIPTTSFNVERMRHRSSMSGTSVDKKTDDEIEYFGPDSKLRNVTVHELTEEEQSHSELWCTPSASMERRDPTGQRGME